MMNDYLTEYKYLKVQNFKWIKATLTSLDKY